MLDITLVQKMEVCKFNQVGFCKFGGKCFSKHENEICKSRNECIDSNCTKRHPKKCRFFHQFGHCKFNDTCVYSHLVEKNIKVEELEKEVTEMKKDLSVKDTKMEELEKEVAELKENVSKFKMLLFGMNNKIKSLEPEVKVIESKETKKVKENEENMEQTVEQMFKCDKCEYRVKRRATFMKHVNTKHGSADKMEGIKEKESGENETETCKNCENCEKCDYMKNSDNCGKCDKIFDTELDNYVAKKALERNK